MFLLYLEYSLSYVTPIQILRVNWFRTLCILLINSHKLSETRSIVYEIVYVLTFLVGSFFRELGFHTSSLCIPLYIDKVLYFNILVLLEYLVSTKEENHLSQC